MQSKKINLQKERALDYGQLLTELLRAKEELQIALNNFSYLTEKNAVDVCIFQMQTAQSQYDNILKRIKKMSV
ncbi:MAG: DUF2508 family protein [Clostridia bacterium]|nr:DUF2508 family protein [Clostridia bacterium]